MILSSRINIFSLNWAWWKVIRPKAFIRLLIFYLSVIQIYPRYPFWSIVPEGLAQQINEGFYENLIVLICLHNIAFHAFIPCYRIKGDGF